MGEDMLASLLLRWGDLKPLYVPSASPVFLNIMCTWRTNKCLSPSGNPDAHIQLTHLLQGKRPENQT